MNLAIFDKPLNLNRWGRRKILKKAFQSEPHIFQSDQGVLTNFSLERIDANIIRIRLSFEKNKQPVIERSFDQFVSKVGVTKAFEEDPLVLKESLEKSRNPKNFIEFIIENIGKKKPKYKLKEASLISPDNNNFKKIDDVSSLKTGDIVELYKHNQAAVTKIPLTSKELNINSLLKNVLEKIKTTKLSPAAQEPSPMVARSTIE